MTEFTDYIPDEALSFDITDGVVDLEIDDFMEESDNYDQISAHEEEHVDREHIPSIPETRTVTEEPGQPSGRLGRFVTATVDAMTDPNLAGSSDDGDLEDIVFNLATRGPLGRF